VSVIVLEACPKIASAHEKFDYVLLINFGSIKSNELSNCTANSFPCMSLKVKLKFIGAILSQDSLNIHIF